MRTFTPAQRKYRAMQESKRRNANPDKIKVARHKSYLKRRVKILAAVKKYRELNPLKIRERYLKVRYNLTIEGWESMFNQQNRSCKICKCTESTGKGWHVDHHHETGQIRGILCHHCNTAIGLLRDSVSIAEEAVIYLKGIE